MGEYNILIGGRSPKISVRLFFTLFLLQDFSFEIFGNGVCDDSPFLKMI